ncbi:hypothetical protein BKA93DRAFT_798925 [Sparassis latifolia]
MSLSLNDDVLFLVTSFLHPLDALRLSETCRHLHLIALPQALSSIVLGTCLQLTAFCRYMLSSPQTRMHLLRAIVIVAPVGDVPNAALLADVFEQALRLRSIHMHHSDTFIEAEPRIGTALAALEDLEDVTLFDAREHVREMLPRLRSKPRKVQLLCPMEYPRLVLHLSQLSTLRHAVTLSLFNITIEDDTLVGQPAAPFVALEYLSLQYAQIPAVLFSFRNLDRVEVWLGEILGPAPDVILSPTLGTVRNVSLDASWIRTAMTEEGIVQALRVLQFVPPLMLTLKIFAYPLRPFWTCLVALSPQLRYLHLELDTMRALENGDRLFVPVSEWLRVVPPLLASLNLHCLRISVADTGFGHTVPQMRDLLWKHIGPSLRYISLKSTPHPHVDWQTRCEYSWWMVEGSGDARRLVAMSVEAGEAIHETLCSAPTE